MSEENKRKVVIVFMAGQIIPPGAVAMGPCMDEINEIDADGGENFVHGFAFLVDWDWAIGQGYAVEKTMGEWDIDEDEGDEEIEEGEGNEHNQHAGW